jgi:hypothetical protein
MGRAGQGRLGEIYISIALPGASLVPQVEWESSGPRSGHGLQNASCMCVRDCEEISCGTHSSNNFTIVAAMLLWRRRRRCCDCCCLMVLVWRC